MGFLKGLESMGLGSLKDAKVIEDTKDAKAGAVAAGPKVETEDEYIINKTIKCPCCDNEFKTKGIKTGKGKAIGSDTDMCPIWSGFDLNKYSVIACPSCGYAAHEKFFQSILGSQIKLIKESITSSFTGLPESGAVWTYEDSVIRYQLAVGCSIVKKAKDSERAFTCWRASWVLRGQADALPKDISGYDALYNDIKNSEKELLQLAYEGFNAAVGKESNPSCGLEDTTFTYLLAALAFLNGNRDDALRGLGRLISNKDVKDNVKKKALELKEKVQAK